MGLLDNFSMPGMDTPQGQGLLAAAFSLMSAKGSSMGNAIGQAGQQYMGTYNQATDAGDQREMRRLQVDTMKRQAEEATRVADLQKWRREAAQRYATPAQPARTLPPILGDSILPQDMQAGVLQSPSLPVATKPAGFDFQGYASELASKDPLEAFEWQQRLQKDDAPVKLSQGESLYSGKASGYKPLLSVPAKDAEPSAVKEYKFAVGQGETRSFTDWVNAQKRAGASNQTVINAGPKAFDTELGKLDAAQLDDWRKGATSAQAALGVVDQLRNSDKSGAYSGSLANLKMTTGKFIESVTGSAPKGTVESQEYNAAASSMVLERVKSLGANPSNADREFIEKTVPQLSQSADARRSLATFIERKANDSIGMYKRANEHARKNRGLGGFDPYPAAKNVDDLVNKYK